MLKLNYIDFATTPIFTKQPIDLILSISLLTQSATFIAEKKFDLLKKVLLQSVVTKHTIVSSGYVSFSTHLTIKLKLTSIEKLINFGLWSSTGYTWGIFPTFFLCSDFVLVRAQYRVHHSLTTLTNLKPC